MPVSAQVSVYKHHPTTAAPDLALGRTAFMGASSPGQGFTSQAGLRRDHCRCSSGASGHAQEYFLARDASHPATNSPAAKRIFGPTVPGQALSLTRSDLPKHLHVPVTDTTCEGPAKAMDYTTNSPFPIPTP